MCHTEVLKPVGGCIPTFCAAIWSSEISSLNVKYTISEWDPASSTRPAPAVWAGWGWREEEEEKDVMVKRGGGGRGGGSARNAPHKLSMRQRRRRRSWRKKKYLEKGGRRMAKNAFQRHNSWCNLHIVFTKNSYCFYVLFFKQSHNLSLYYIIDSITKDSKFIFREFRRKTARLMYIGLCASYR